MSTATIEKAERWNVTREQYHADRECLSNSALGDFIKSPKLYHGRHVTGIYPREESTAFDLGTIVHQMVLEPDAEPSYVVIPASALSKAGRRQGAAWDAFEAENAGKILMKPEEFAPVRSMIQALREHPDANRLLFCDGGENERAIRWDCERHGIKRRILIDRLLPNAIIDLKTSGDASPAGFAKSAWDFSYQRQQSFYQDGVLQLVGKWLPFFFVVVQKTAPYSVGVYDLNETFAEAGYYQIESEIPKLVECRRSGNWRASWESGVITIDPPRYSKYADEYSFA